MGVEPRTLALLAPRSKPTELIDREHHVIRAKVVVPRAIYLGVPHLLAIVVAIVALSSSFEEQVSGRSW